MKSNTIIKQLYLCLVTLLTVYEFASANQGGSSGSGNNGEGFSIAGLRARQPGLSVQEILTEAFELSKGQIPKFMELLPLRRKIELGDLGLEVLNSKKGQIIRNLDYSKITTGEIINYGPLFDNALEAKNISLSIGEDIHVWVKKTSDSLLFYYNGSNGKKDSPYLEIRQLNEKELIYVKYVFQFEDGQFWCNERFATGLVEGSQCAIGYIWKR